MGEICEDYLRHFLEQTIPTAKFSVGYLKEKNNNE